MNLHGERAEWPLPDNVDSEGLRGQHLLQDEKRHTVTLPGLLLHSGGKSAQFNPEHWGGPSPQTIETNCMFIVGQVLTRDSGAATPEIKGTLRGGAHGCTCVFWVCVGLTVYLP